MLVVNWQDRENPHAGGAEIHLHEIFGRLAARGHEVTLLCGGWPGCAPRAHARRNRRPSRGHAAHVSVPRAPLLARVPRAAGFDVLVEDMNKVPLYTPRWGARNVIALVPHLFGETAFEELGFALGSAVWLAERPLGVVYRSTPFEAITEIDRRRSRRARHSARARPRDLPRRRRASAYTPDPRPAVAGADRSRILGASRSTRASTS